MKKEREEKKEKKVKVKNEEDEEDSNLLAYMSLFIKESSSLTLCILKDQHELN